MRDLSKSIGYCRVSTQRQHTEGHGLERYIANLKQYGLRDDQIYWDIESGSNEKRLGYNKVLNLVRSQQVTQIIVPCFDRFTRSPLGWEQAKNELLEFGVELIFLDGGSLNLETPEGLFTSRILAAMSAQVRDKNRYNSIQGHRFFQENRKVYQVVFGLVKDGDFVKPNRNPYKSTGRTYQEVAIEAIDLFLEHGNIAKVVTTLCEKYGYERDPVKHLDFPRTPSSFKRWVENPVLCGMIRYYAEEREKTIVLKSPNNEGIISEDKFNQVLQLISKPPHSRHTNQSNPLVSLCWCGNCGSRMRKTTNTNIKKSGKKYQSEYLQCTGARPKPGRLQVCDCTRFFKFPLAIAATIEAIKQRTDDIIDSLNALDNTIETEYSPEIIQLQQEIIKLKSMGDNDYLPVIKTKENKLESLLNKRSQISTSTEFHRELYSHFLQSSGFWKSVGRDDLNVIFHELVDKVVCFDVDGVQSFSVILKD